MKPGIRGVLAALLVLGAAVNLAAGVRRPLRERAILSGDHYAQADRAAQAVSRALPANTPLQVVVYDQDLLGELDAGVWFDYRIKWLQYPRPIIVSRVAPERPLTLRPEPGAPPPPSPHATYLDGDYVLFFRASAPPTLPSARLERVAEGPMWVLTRRAGAAHARNGG